MKLKLTRTTAALGALAIAAVGLTAIAGPASADLVSPTVKGTAHGALVIGTGANPTGTTAQEPDWHTTQGCPAGQQNNAQLYLVKASGVPSAISAPMGPLDTDLSVAFDSTPLDVASGNFPGPMNGNTLATILSLNSIAMPSAGNFNTVEFYVGCESASLVYSAVMDTFLTFDSTGAWTESANPPSAKPSAVIGVQTLDPTSHAALTSIPAGGSVELKATFTGTAPTTTGTFEYDIQGGTTGNTIQAGVPVTAGVADITVNTLPSSGVLNIYFVYPGDGNYSPTTSPAVTFVIQGASSETIDVDIPSDEGVFTYTVDPSPVHLGQAAHVGNFFTIAGNLNNVSVHDGRHQSTPGWQVSGQIGDFAKGAATVNGDDLGWTPSVVTQDPKADVVAGAATTAGVTPGLKEGSELAHAVHPGGQDDSVLGAGVNLKFPDTTGPGNYVATITFTAVTTD